MEKAWEVKYHMLILVTQSAFISDWFKDNEMAFAMGMTICLARAGTVLNYIISPPIYEATKSLAFSFWVGTFMMGIALILVMATVLLDQDTEIKGKHKVYICQLKIFFRLK